jgi:small-conductance mechanosensitive channel
MSGLFANLENRLSDPLWNLLVLTGALLIGILIKWIIHKTIGFYIRRSDHYLFKAISRHLSAPAAFFIPLVIVNASLGLMKFNDRSIIAKATELCLILAFAFLIIGAIRLFENIVYERNDIRQTDNLKARKIRTQIGFITRFAIGIVILVAIAAILLSFESLRKIGTGLLAGVGLGGIIIGFAAQSTLSNVIAGFQIAFTQPVRIDDVVIAEGEWGRIEDITLTYVVMRLWDDRRLVLPINYFITKPFQNWTRVSTDLLGTVFLYMDYSLPIDKVREKFESLLKASALWDGRVKAVQVTDCKERVIEIRLLMSARNASDAFDLRCFIREQVITFIQANYPGALPKTRSEAVVQRDDGDREEFPRTLPRN